MNILYIKKFNADQQRTSTVCRPGYAKDVLQEWRRLAIFKAETAHEGAIVRAQDTIHRNLLSLALNLDVEMCYAEEKQLASMQAKHAAGTLSDQDYQHECANIQAQTNKMITIIYATIHDRLESIRSVLMPLRNEFGATFDAPGTGGVLS